MKVVYNNEEKELLDGANGFDAAKALDPEKKNKALAYRLGGKLFDMREPIAEGGEISFVMGDDPDGFEMMNHSCSHLMAQALQHLYPGCLFGFGPAIEEGFYYDVDFGDKVITESDFAAIEAEMKKLSKGLWKAIVAKSARKKRSKSSLPTNIRLSTSKNSKAPSPSTSRAISSTSAVAHTFQTPAI